MDDLFEALDRAGCGGATGRSNIFQRSAFKYSGSKFSALQHLLPLIPRAFDRYVEPFCGTGTVLFNKIRHKVEILNDKDKMIANFFLVLQERPGALRNALDLLPVSRTIWTEYFTRIAERKYDKGLEQALLWYYVIVNSFGGTFDSFGRQVNTPTKGHHAVTHRFTTLSNRLKGVLIECKHVMEILDEFDSSDTVMYLDPPYMKDLMSSPSAYMNEMTEDEHLAMLDKVMDMNSYIILSSYDNPLYNSYRWDDVLSYTLNVRPIRSGAGAPRSKQIEKAYIKYEAR